jgi:hypothetical protein
LGDCIEIVLPHVLCPLTLAVTSTSESLDVAARDFNATLH